MKNVAVLTADKAFALYFCPHPGGFDSSIVPTPRNWLMHNSRYQKQKAYFSRAQKRKFNLLQVAHYQLHEQGQYQERQGKVTRCGTKKWCSHNL